MSIPPPLAIEVNETFPHLSRSPLIEAVIDWQAHANKPLDTQTLKEELSRQLPEYPTIHVHYEHGIGIPLETSGQPDISGEVIHQKEWKGFRLQNESKTRVVHFTKTGVAISSIGGYESWDTFYPEALNLWSIFQELAEPTSINRLGVRYINKVQLEERQDVSTYLNIVPQNSFGLPLERNSFFYQETYQVPGYPYGVEWVCTQQSEVDKQFLIVDIDIFISDLVNIEKLNLVNHLNRIRWLKNKIFFNSITNIALEKFEGQQ